MFLNVNWLIFVPIGGNQAPIGNNSEARVYVVMGRVEDKPTRVVFKSLPIGVPASINQLAFCRAFIAHKELIFFPIHFLKFYSGHCCPEGY